MARHKLPPWHYKNPLMSSVYIGEDKNGSIHRQNATTVIDHDRQECDTLLRDDENKLYAAQPIARLSPVLRGTVLDDWSRASKSYR